MNTRQKIVLSVICVLVISIGFFGWFVMRDHASAPITTKTEHAVTESWQFIDANAFTVLLPPNWEFKKRQGIDSYVAEFVGDGMTLSFDYGWYSYPLADESDTSSSVTYETIDGKKAKLVVPKETGNGTTGMYVEDVGDGKNHLQISGNNLTSSQQDVALTIFRTIKFTKSQ